MTDRLNEQEDERQQAHEAAGDLLENLRSENRWTELQLSPFEVALESRTRYLEADQFDRALSVSDDIFKVLSANGMNGEIYQLSQELLQHRESPAAMNWTARALSGTGEVNEADYWFDRAISASEPDSPAYATAKHGKGALRFSSGKITEGRELLRQAISVRQGLGNRIREASSRQVLGSSYAAQGKFERAREQFDKSLNLLEGTDDLHARANTMKEISSLERLRGNFNEAKQKYLDALDVFQQLGDRSLEAHVIHALGSLYLNQQKLETARERFESALELSRKIHNRRREALALHQLAAVDYRSGKFEEAREGYQKAIVIYQKVGMRRELGTALHDLGLILKESKRNTRDALQKFLTALAIHQEVGDQPGEATTLSVIGTIAWEIGVREVGLKLMILGYDLMEQTGHHDARKLKDQAEMYLFGQYFLQTGVDRSVEEMRERAQNEYDRDHGWGLIQEAFPDADLPEDVPPPGDGE